MSDVTGLGRVQRIRNDPTAAHAGILPLVSDRLDRVEDAFREHLDSPVRIVDEIGGFVADGGKRIRPTLHLLCAQLCGYEGPHDVLLGTVVEFIHCATLIHDDIIDEATTRRGRPSVNEKWGNNVTVLFGDYMFAKAMELALRAGSLKVMEKLAEVTLRMTEGEMLQTRYVGRLDLTEAEYLDLVERKTAALFACCCELAGIVSGVDDERVEGLRRYGLHLGFAFQLVDDLLDFTGDPDVLGKPAANDLREGKATLAVIDLLARGDRRARTLASEVMEGDGQPNGAIAELTAALGETGAIERTYGRAEEHARQAVAELQRFDPSPARDALEALPDLLLSRDH